MKKLICIMALFLCTHFLHAMDDAMDVETHQQVEREFGDNIIWVQTSDEQLFEVPKWQIDQMKVLRVLFVHQKGHNSEENPLSSGGLTAEELELLQDALNVAYCTDCLKKFFRTLSDDQQRDVVNAADKIQATGLTSLLMSFIFPLELQQQMLNVSQIMTPVMHYLDHTCLDGKQRVKCVTFSPDGTFIIAGLNHSVVCWDSLSGNKENIFAISEFELVSCLAHNADGERMVLGYDGLLGGYGDIVLFNKQHEVITSHKLDGAITCVAFSSDGHYFVAGSLGSINNLILYDSYTGNEVRNLHGHTKSILCVSFNADGHYLASGSHDNTIIVRDVETDERVGVFEHQDPILCLSFNPHNNKLIAGSSGQENNLILWDVDTQNITQLPGHTDEVKCVAWSPDGSRIVSGSRDKNLILWNENGEQIAVLEGHQGVVWCVEWSPDGKYIFSGALDHNVIMWDGHTGKLIRTLQGHNNEISCLAVSPQGDSLAVGSDSDLILWRLVDQTVLNYIKNKLTVAQAQFIYRLYLATINEFPLVIDMADPDYAVYVSLPDAVQKLITTYFPFKTPSQAIQEKKAEFKKQLFEQKKTFLKSLYERLFGEAVLTIDEKITRVMQLMEKVDKNSLSYKALQKILVDLQKEEEMEEEFMPQTQIGCIGKDKKKEVI